MSEWLPVVFGFVFGAVVFLLGYLYLSKAGTNYRRSFLEEVGGTLDESFIFIDPRRLFAIIVSFSVVIGIVVGLLFGVVLAAIVVAIVAVMPWIVVKKLKLRRIDTVLYQLPDVLASMAASLRAGANLTRGIEQVVAQYPPPISQEFGILLAEYRMGRDLKESLDALKERVPRQEIDLMNSAILISRAVGGNLADTLGALAETIREKLRMEGKIRALTAMGRMQGWVIGLAPLGMGFAIYKQDPQTMGLLFKDPIGWAVLVVLATLMIAAMYMIRKIVNIDV